MRVRRNMSPFMRLCLAGLAVVCIGLWPVGCSVPAASDGGQNDNTIDGNDGSNVNGNSDADGGGGDTGDGSDSGTNANDGGDQSGDNGDGQGDGGSVAGKFATFRIVTSSSSPQGLDGDGVVVDGELAGVEGENVQLVFVASDGGQVVADVDAEGRFQAPLDPDQDYHIDLLQDGRFEAPLISDDRSVDDSDPPAEGLMLEVVDGALGIVDGPIETQGDPLMVDDSDVPVGISDDVDLIGLTDAGQVVEEPTDAVDADLDGIPAIFDVDKDGDGIIDLSDDDVPAGVPDPVVTGADGESVGGAFVFNNLKLDIDQLIAAPTSLFTHNDSAVVTIGWQEDPGETPAGYTVQSVEAVDVPGWHRYGFATTVVDWSVSPGMPSYIGYPAFGSSWTGQLYQESSGSPLWQVWVQSPKADATLAASYPSYVEVGKSVPLNWDLSASGVPTSNKIDYYRLKITYTDGTSTLTRFSPASSLFSFRTPGVALTVTTTAASYTIDPNNVSGDGHRSNPIVYPDTGTPGDIVMEGLPPKFDVSGSSGIITGDMNWRFDVFYYDSAGQQIGGVLTNEVTITYTGAANVVVTLPASILDRSGSRTDMNGDGMDDITGGKTSADVAAYKIDLTAVAITGSDNTGLFLYFVSESVAGSFAGF